MPIYVYKCSECDQIQEILHPMSEVGEERMCSCKKQGKLQRTYTAVNIRGMSGGKIRSEQELLKMKQKEKSERSKLHFKKEVLPTIKSPGERRFFEKRLKHIDANKKLK